MSTEVFSPILKEKVPEALKRRSVFGPFEEEYRARRCVYFGGFKHGLKFGWGKLMLEDGSYVEGVFDGDCVGRPKPSRGLPADQAQRKHLLRKMPARKDPGLHPQVLQNQAALPLPQRTQDQARLGNARRGRARGAAQEKGALPRGTAGHRSPTSARRTSRASATKSTPATRCTTLWADQGKIKHNKKDGCGKLITQSKEVYGTWKSDQQVA